VLDNKVEIPYNVDVILMIFTAVFITFHVDFLVRSKVVEVAVVPVVLRVVP